MKNQKAKNTLLRIVAVSLILFPLILMVAFASHYTNLADFFTFELKYEPNSTSAFMDTLTGPNRLRSYTIPHGIAYFSVPFMLVVILYLGYLLRNRQPWLALVGAVLGSLGAIYLGSLFGTWLSFDAIGNLDSGQAAGALPALAALTEMQGILLLTTMLSALSLVGLLILAVGMFIGHVGPRWASGLVAFGNLLILVFMDLDNWMFIGALMILIGFTPLISNALRGNASEEIGPALGEPGAA